MSPQLPLTGPAVFSFLFLDPIISFYHAGVLFMNAKDDFGWI